MTNPVLKKQMIEFIADNLAKDYNQTKGVFGPHSTIDIIRKKQLTLDHLLLMHQSPPDTEPKTDAAKLILIGEHTPNFEETGAVAFDKLKNSIQIPLVYIFLKDGTTFFRSNAQRLHHKSRYGRSLKRYDSVEVNKIIIFSPEEIFAFYRNNPSARTAQNPQSIIQYYQPKSERLFEALVSYLFEPVLFDYTHRPELMMSRYVAPQEHSKRRFQWTKGANYIGSLEIDSRTKTLVGQNKITF